MAVELDEFYNEFFQDIISSADADGRYAEDAFFERFCDELVDAGELETADRAQYIGARGLRVDGYGGDPAQSDGTLSLIIADFNQSQTIGTLTATEMDAIFKRLQNFLVRSLEAAFRSALESSQEAAGLADLIAMRWPNISRVRLFLISNRLLSARVDGREAGEVQGVPVSYSVWDIGRLYRFAEAGRGREDINIDLKADFGGGLHALPAHLKDAGYEAYLIAIPGIQLARIYDRWGARLLEQNVRVFLQAKGNVNKGIRNTIENSPEMFFAYNNGVTATAEALQTENGENGLVVTGLTNLQIVNGGQTTASIHAASRKKEIDLSKVFVQMKLSIVERERAIEVVPRISEFANSQNRVNAADFFANHPFHVRMEEFSRRIFAPSPDGSFRESKWFYERARGQYHDAKAYLTASQRKKFELEYPKDQVFSKTDLAKFLNVWRGHPDVVSKGAQKNFAQFAGIIGAEWTKQSDAFNENFYRHSIAKAIIYREVEKIVTDQPWYQGGYRANVVAYAIAKLGHDVEATGLAVDFDKVWKSQTVSSAMRHAFIVFSTAVHDVIVDPPTGMRNVTEWAKQQGCWKRVESLEIPMPDAFAEELVSKDEARETKKSAAKDQRLLNGIEAQTAVITAGSAMWKELRDWGLGKRLLTPMEIGVLDAASSAHKRLPTEKQSLKAMEIHSRLSAEGFRPSARPS